MSENIVSPPALEDTSRSDDVQVVPPPPPPKKPSILHFFILLFLSVVAVIAIYLFLQVRQLALEKTSPSPTPTPTASVDPTSTWQQFNHPTQGYSFRYPSSILVKVDESTPAEIIFYASTTPDFIIGGIEIRELAVTPEQWIASEKKSGVEIFEQLKYSTTYTSGTKIKASKAMDYYAYVVAREDMLYILSLIITNQEDEVLFDQILSTFKFTNTSSDTTFTCPANGWQSCMPVLSEEGKRMCSDDAITWYKKNCPDFQGVALWT